MRNSINDVVKNWLVLILAVLAFAAQWGILTQKVSAFEKDHEDVNEIRLALSTLVEAANTNKEDHKRFEQEILQIRDILSRK